MASEVREYKLKESLRIRGSDRSGWSKKGDTVKLDLKTAQQYHQFLDPDPGPRPKAPPAPRSAELGRWMADELIDTAQKDVPQTIVVERAEEVPESETVESEPTQESPEESEAEPEEASAEPEPAPEPAAEESAEPAVDEESDEEVKQTPKKPARRRSKSSSAKGKS